MICSFLSFMKHRSLHRYAISYWNLEITHVFVLLKRLFFLMHSLNNNSIFDSNFVWDLEVVCFIHQEGSITSLTESLHLLSIQALMFWFSSKHTWPISLCNWNKCIFFHLEKICFFFCYSCFGKNRLVIICFISLMSFTSAWVVKHSSVKTWCLALNTGNTIKIS